MTDNHLLLFRVAELMLEQEQHILPVDLLFDDEQISDYVKSIQIDSPYQQMLQEGVLTESVRDEKLYVSFTVEGYFHFVLGEVIYNQTEGKGAEVLKQIVEENKLNSVKEGIEQCLIRDVHKADLSRLIWLIDKSDKLLDIAVLPISIAFISFKVKDVLIELLNSPTNNDLILVDKVCSYLEKNLLSKLSDEIKEGLKDFDKLYNLLFHEHKSVNIIKVKDNFKLLRQLNIKLSDEINEKEIQKIKGFISLFFKNKSSLNAECLDWISVLVDLNALNQAKQFYTKFIKVVEKRKDNELLVLALENLGNSEYKRSSSDGYKVATSSLTRAAEMRESETVPQNDKLKYTYRLLGLAYLSLGLQVVKSTEYFEKAKVIMLEESSESKEVADINFYIGLVYYWRGLRGTGRWGEKDETLLRDLVDDPFVIAHNYWDQAIELRSKLYGKIHPDTFSLFHYTQEASYSLGKYELAIPWLKKYLSIIPFKDKEHTDNIYLYSLIVSEEEYAKQLTSTNSEKALVLIQDAYQYTLNYDERNEITNRLTNVKKQIEAGKIKESVYQNIDMLPPLEVETLYGGVWNKWQFSEDLKGFQTNNWMISSDGIWFFNNEKKLLKFWNKKRNKIVSFNPSHWPEGCSRIVYDNQNHIFYAWYSIRSTVYALKAPDGNWSRISFGVHDVHACGASFGYDPVSNRLYEFGGYGYYTYKNWLWVYDLELRKWMQIKENKPGISPYPRNGQLLHTNDNTKVVLLSGIGSDTGIQREHKARLGLANATDVGYFTWLRDAHELDLKTLEWKTILPANHESIRHEGPMGFIEELNLVINWGGQVPSPIFGKDPEIQNRLSGWQLSNNKGFLDMKFDGEIPPLTEGTFISIKDSKELLYNHSQGIWKLVINDI